MTKHVVNTPQVAHLWAHQAQDHARNSGNSLSFDGPMLKSYRLAIGNIVDSPVDGSKIALILDTYDTLTTKRHIEMAQRAVRHMTSFRAPWIEGSQHGNYTLERMHARNVAWYLREYAEIIGKARRGQTGADWRLEQARATLSRARSYAALFAVQPKGAWPDADTDCASVREHWASRDARANDPKVLAARERAAERKRERIRDAYRNCVGDFAPTVPAICGGEDKP